MRNRNTRKRVGKIRRSKPSRNRRRGVSFAGATGRMKRLNNYINSKL